MLERLRVEPAREQQPLWGEASHGLDAQRVPAVHRDDEVEDLEIAGGQGAGSLLRDVYAMPPGHLDAPAVRGLALVVRAGSGAVEGELVFTALLANAISRDTFCQRRAADVPQAEEKDMNRKRLVGSSHFVAVAGFAAMVGFASGCAGLKSYSFGTAPAPTSVSRAVYNDVRYSLYQDYADELGPAEVEISRLGSAWFDVNFAAGQCRNFLAVPEASPNRIELRVTTSDGVELEYAEGRDDRGFLRYCARKAENLILTVTPTQSAARVVVAALRDPS
jgi:hypothetical protein